MPIHDYKCSTCGKEVELLVKFSDADDQLCGCAEGVKIDKVDKIYTPAFQLVGRGWTNRGK